MKLAEFHIVGKGALRVDDSSGESLTQIQLATELLEVRTLEKRLGNSFKQLFAFLLDGDASTAISILASVRLRSKKIDSQYTKVRV